MRGHMCLSVRAFIFMAQIFKLSFLALLAISFPQPFLRAYRIVCQKSLCGSVESTWFGFDPTYLYRSPPQHSPGLSALAGHQVSGGIPLNQSGVSVKVT